MSGLSETERASILQAIMTTMAELQQTTERLCGYLLTLDPDGTRFPSMRRTAETLAQVATGWEMAAPR